MKRHEVIDAAAIVFHRKGYRAATLGDVAALLDTNRATLYYYVSGKEELLREVVSGAVLDVVAEVREIAASPRCASDKLRDFVTGLISTYEAHYPHLYVFLQERLEDAWPGHAEWSQELELAETELETLLLDILRQGVREHRLRADLSPELVMNAIFGMINWMHRWYLPAKDRFTIGEIGDCFTAMVLQGLEQLPSASGDGGGPVARRTLMMSDG